VRSYKKGECPCCQKSRIIEFKSVQQYHYYRCISCGTIFIDTLYLKEIDNGLNIVKYDNTYWDFELPAALERSYGVALARMAEAFYYSRIPINRFLDIATGTGYFLDAVAKLLPNHKDTFYGIEKFPPPKELRIQSPHYIMVN